MKEKHRIAPHPAAFSFTLALLLVLTALLASSCGESSEVRSLKATISAQATQLAEVATTTVTRLASPTPPPATVFASPTPPPPEPKPRASLIPIWSVKCGGEKPLVAGDVVVTSTTEDYLMGLARVTGDKLWEWEVEGTAFAGDQERVYVYAAYSRLYALELYTGERVWKIEHPMMAPCDLGSGGSGILYLYDGMLYFTMSTGGKRHLVAVDASSGEEKWVYHSPSVAAIGVRLLPEGLQVSSSGFDTMGLDPQTGEVLWGPGESKREPSEWDIGDVRLLYHQGEAVDLSDGTITWTWDRAAIGHPIGVWSDVVVLSKGPSLYGISAEDGVELWDLDLQGPHYWAGAPGGVAILVNPAGVHGVEIASGERIWKVRKEVELDARGVSKTTLAKFALTDIGLLFFSGEGGTTLDLVDPATGEVRWMKEVSGWVESIVDAGDSVLIVSGATNISYTLTAYEKVR